MAQKITVRIAERDYAFNAADAEQEELIRLAANAINRRLSGYLAKYPGKNMVDIMSFVALNETIGSLSLQRKMESLQKEIKALQEETDSYLDNNLNSAILSIWLLTY